MGEGLFAVDIEAFFRSGNRGDGVPVIRQGDAHRVDIDLVIQFFKVAEGLAVRVFVGAIHHVAGILEVVGVNITHGDDAAALVAKKAFQVVGSLPADADGDDVDHIVGTRVVAAGSRAGGEKEGCRSVCRCAFQKPATGKGAFRAHRYASLVPDCHWVVQ